MSSTSAQLRLMSDLRAIKVGDHTSRGVQSAARHGAAGAELGSCAAAASAAGAAGRRHFCASPPTASCCRCPPAGGASRGLQRLPSQR
jgi:hypothetical protein